MKKNKKIILIVLPVVVIALAGAFIVVNRLAVCAAKYAEEERNYFITKGDIKGEYTSKYDNLSCPPRGPLAEPPR